MKKNKKRIFTMIAAGLALLLTGCGGNNGDMPAEDEYQNTTESAPEATDNITGFGNIADSVSADSSMQQTGAASDSAGADTTGTTSGSTTGTTTSETTTGD
ncbi:hypothetical protein I2I11_15270 [Pontibacter sp. 172403-2]|uniref:hypothetical protein n=1 Tax=Pontibacter rufus TaxID=2791028 RepID=UPI0018AFB833|nr:hypothetical protein [Pontibacter sp. 172403-2]MBF9254664.1 hypothetical protein [Pontibacter sp. 172403-2]